jgi:hypothetical protein
MHSEESHTRWQALGACASSRAIMNIINGLRT